MEQIYNLQLELKLRGTDSPLTGNEYKVKFFDKDLMEDDFLGEGTPDHTGKLSIPITASKFRSKDSPLELNPDVYFIVYKNEDEIFRSPVIENLHLKKLSDFDVSEGMNYNLGTYVIDGNH